MLVNGISIGSTLERRLLGDSQALFIDYIKSFKQERKTLANYKRVRIIEPKK